VKKLFSIVLAGFIGTALVSAPIGCQGAAKEKDKDAKKTTDDAKKPDDTKPKDDKKG
jgi:hypothetical protein